MRSKPNFRYQAVGVVEGVVDFDKNTLVCGGRTWDVSFAPWLKRSLGLDTVLSPASGLWAGYWAVYPMTVKRKGKPALSLQVCKKIPPDQIKTPLSMIAVSGEVYHVNRRDGRIIVEVKRNRGKGRPNRFAVYATRKSGNEISVDADLLSELESYDLVCFNCILAGYRLIVVPGSVGGVKVDTPSEPRPRLSPG